MKKIKNDYDDGNYLGINKGFYLRKKKQTILFGDILVDFFDNGCRMKQKLFEKGTIIMDFKDMRHLIKRLKDYVEKAEIMRELENEK